MEPATAQPPDTRPRAPAQPDSHPHQPGYLPGTIAPGYTSTFRGRAEEGARVRREIAGYLENCPAAGDMVLIASELAANAIVHTRSRSSTFRVRCQLTPRVRPDRGRGHGRPLAASRPRRPAPRPGHHPGPYRPGRMGNPARRHRRPHRLGLAVMVTRRRRGGQAPRRALRHRRCEHPRPAPAQRLDRGPARQADGLDCQRHRLRRRRPPRRPTTPLHHRGNPAAGRHLRRPRLAACHPVRDLRRPAAGRIRLASLRSRPRPRPPGRPGAPARESASGSTPVSTGVDGATVLVTVSACATLSAGTVHLSLTAREGPPREPGSTTSTTATTTAPPAGASPGRQATWTS